MTFWQRHKERILVGAFMTGLACEVVRDLQGGGPGSLRAARVGGAVHYGTLTLLWHNSTLPRATQRRWYAELTAALADQASSSS